MHEDKERSSATQRSVDRRRREDDSPRLMKEVPSLRRLRISVTEGSALSTHKHMRHIIVPSAPALFLFPCGDKWCENGGYDLTSSILYALRSLRTTFVEHHTCDGSVGSATCRRTLDLELFAEYAAQLVAPR
jgi:hypothetical protein